MAEPHPFDIAPIARAIWEKHQLRTPGGEPVDATVEATWRRVAEAAAGAERGARRKRDWADRFYEGLADFGFLPAGRIIAGAGTSVL